MDLQDIGISSTSHKRQGRCLRVILHPLRTVSPRLFYQQGHHGRQHLQKTIEKMKIYTVSIPTIKPVFYCFQIESRKFDFQPAVDNVDSFWELVRFPRFPYLDHGSFKLNKGNLVQHRKRKITCIFAHRPK